jgi:hypothetical protein
MSLNSLYIVFDERSETKITQKEYIDLLIEFEKIILFKIDINHKVCQYKIRDYLKYLNSKLGDDFKLYKYILKISGIWETHDDYGITFKFLENKLENE